MALCHLIVRLRLRRSFNNKSGFRTNAVHLLSITMHNSRSPPSGRLLTTVTASFADRNAPANSLSGTVSVDNLHRLPMFVLEKQVLSADLDLAYPIALYPVSEPSDGNMKPVSA